MAQNNRYIVCLVFSKQAIHRRGRKAHNTYSQKKSESDNHRGSDKPPGKINNPNRNAKFTPCFSRGEFGVFCHALSNVEVSLKSRKWLCYIAKYP